MHVCFDSISMDTWNPHEPLFYPSLSCRLAKHTILYGRRGRGTWLNELRISRPEPSMFICCYVPMTGDLSENLLYKLEDCPRLITGG